VKPGIYYDLPNDKYQTGEGVSKSNLDLVNTSPLHLRAKQTAANDNGPPSKALYFGTAFHALMLEHEVFASLFVLALELPENALVTQDDLKAACKESGLPVSGTKAEQIKRLKDAGCKYVFADELKAEFALKHSGKTILSQDEWDRLHHMRAAVRAHPAASKLMGLKGHSEVSFYWRDEVTGELCRCRADKWVPDMGLVVDLKTTEDASLDEFNRSIAKYRYHVQDAYYSDGIPAAGGGAVNQFAFVAVQKDARVVEGVAYGVAVYVLDKDSRQLGRDQYRKNLNDYAKAKKSGVWPCYGDTVQMIGLPGWYMNRATEKLAS